MSVGSVGFTGFAVPGWDGSIAMLPAGATADMVFVFTEMAADEDAAITKAAEKEKFLIITDS